MNLVLDFTKLKISGFLFFGLGRSGTKFNREAGTRPSGQINWLIAAICQKYSRTPFSFRGLDCLTQILSLLLGPKLCAQNFMAWAAGLPDGLFSNLKLQFG
jgi:hypothetical protein